MPEEITAYKTKDGELFVTLELALKHETWLEFQEWYHTNACKLRCVEDPVDICTLASWLSENREQVLKFLDVPVKKPENGTLGRPPGIYMSSRTMASILSASTKTRARAPVINKLLKMLPEETVRACYEASRQRVLALPEKTSGSLAHTVSAAERAEVGAWAEALIELSWVACRRTSFHLSAAARKVREVERDAQLTDLLSAILTFDFKEEVPLGDILPPEPPTGSADPPPTPEEAL